VTAEISWEQFAAVDMRVGRVTAVEEFPEARVPAWKLAIDFGSARSTRRRA
jgi:tRNA-binding protein